MADIKYDISVGVQKAIEGLNQVVAKIDDVNQRFENITNGINNFAAVASAALIGLGTAAAAFADEISDIAAANESTVASVLALSSALQGAGGNADSASKFFQAFANNIEAANGGNMKTLASFQRLGISIKELGTMGQEELRDKVLDALTKISDPAERNARAVEMFNKSMMGVDVVKFTEDLEAQRSKYVEYEGAITTAGEAFGKMESLMKDLKIAAAQAFEPLFKYISKLNVDVNDLVKIIRIFGAVLAAAVSVSVLAGFARLLAILKDINTVVSKNKLITIIGAALAVGTAVGTWTGLINDSEDAQDGVNEKLAETEKKVQTVKRDQTGLNDQIKKQKDTLLEVSNAYNRQLANIREKLQFEQEALGLSEEQKKIKQEQNNIEQQTQNALNSLKQKYDALDADARKARAADYARERELIQANGEQAKKDIEDRISATLRLRAAIEDIRGAYDAYGEAQKQVFETLAKYQTDTSDITKRAELEGRINEITKIRAALLAQTNKLAETERADAVRAIYDATTANELLGSSVTDVNAEIANMIQQLVKMGNLSQDSANKILDGTRRQREGISLGAQNIVDANNTILSESRRFQAGWDKAFREYADSATNAAQIAGRIFNKVTQGMEDAIVNFAKTGKFEFKDFLNTILEELLRSQIRQLMAQMFTAGTGGGTSLLGSIGRMLGFANGGIIPTNGPVLVGERGPEILSGAAGRVVTPNNQLGGSTVVNYNISAVDAMSFRQMVARDPSFLYAVTEQGRRTLPGGR